MLAEAEKVLNQVASEPGRSGVERRRLLRGTKDAYRQDFECNLNLYYEGINVLALEVGLDVGYGDQQAAAAGRKVLPVVCFAAQLARVRPDERYWAEATIAECALHQIPARRRRPGRDPCGFLTAGLASIGHAVAWQA